ncbi:hypothetical protein [Ochrobactrum sp. BTU1]|uniref:hypothetical protein n=1 Tax=Ochrobactrum sp. BTU1 TaxID=2840456 RepID=UPI001C044A4F|nr:hypothetical protein KMS41_19100 [Ochrobactrum sp. BTU1]
MLIRYDAADTLNSCLIGSDADDPKLPSSFFISFSCPIFDIIEAEYKITEIGDNRVWKRSKT